MSLSPRRTAVFVATSMVVLTLSACGQGDDGAETTDSGLTRLVIDYNPTANNAQLSLGIEQGIFERHGLEIEQVPGSGASANSVALLLNGQIDMAAGEITGIPAAVAAGFPVEVVNSFSADYESPDGDAFSVVVPADSDIESFADLEGATVAVNGLESIFDLALQAAVREEGGDPADVEIIAVPFEDQVAALRQGRIDAVSTIEPFAGQMTSDGDFRSIGNPNAVALGARSVVATLFASQEFAQENPDVLQDFTEAWQEATEYANENPDEVRATIVETTGAPAEAVESLPLPWYVSGIDRRSAALVAELMVEHGRLESAPELDDWIWEGAPDATDLENPPAALQGAS